MPYQSGLSPLRIILCVLFSACATQKTIDRNGEIISSQIADNEKRCDGGDYVLIGCEYESWGKNKLILLITGKTATLSDVGKRDLGRKLEFDNKFPSVDYAMGNRKKDLLATQLEKSGFCAFAEVSVVKGPDTKTTSKRNQKSFVAFVPASILSGLTEEGTVFLRRWSVKRPAKQKPSDNVSPQTPDRSSNLPEDTTAKCVVESRQKEDASESQEPSKDSQSKPENTPASSIDIDNTKPQN